MNSQLWWNLKIKEKEWKQSLIVRDVKQNEIVRIMKKTEKTNMSIINYQEKIMFSEMKMLKHKIILKMNWLWQHNLRIDWKWKKVIIKNCECKIRQIKMKSWMKVKKQILQQYWKYKKLFMKSSENQALLEHKSWNYEISFKKKATSEKLLIY